MFIGHLPAGYLCTRAMWSIRGRAGHAMPRWKPYLLIGLTASMVPDIDVLYFYLIDHRQHLHHGYWTHLPCYWALIGLVSLLFILISRRKWLLPYLEVAAVNIFVHLCLDTLVGKVRWLYPISKKDFFLVEVPAVHDWWVLNFILHWTLLPELILLAAAVCVYVRFPPTEGTKPDPIPLHVSDARAGS